MDLPQVLTALCPDDAEAIQPADWLASQAAYPAGGPAFLDAGFVAQAAQQAYVPAAAQRRAIDVAARVAADPALRAFAWHCHFFVFGPGAYSESSASVVHGHGAKRSERPRGPIHGSSSAVPSAPDSRDAIRRWPLPVAALGEDAGLFYLLVLLSNMPALRETYRRRAIPEAVARHTLSDVERWVRRYHEAHGAWGLHPRALTWLNNHLQGRLYQLARLQHQLNEFRGGVIVYRRRADGAVVALSEAGARYRADGQYDGAGGVFDPDGAWTATLDITPAGVEGYPVSPVGYVRRQPVHLPASDWEEALTPGDPVLQLHIPDGSPMDFDACGESFRLALDYFPRHFPEHRFRAFACSSWLLDAQLQDLLPPSSNLVRFQREVYLCPAPGDGRTMLTTVFGALPEDLRQAPRQTTLQRALLDHLARGGRARSGRCFLLREDVRWGNQVYRCREHQP